MSQPKTNKEIYAYCRARYYCGYCPADEGYNQLCEAYECWDDVSIKELIQDDVIAIQEFMKGK